MWKELRKPCERLDNRRAELLARLRVLPVDRLQFRPSPTAWTLAAIAEHLMRVEKALVADARQTLLSNPHPVNAKESFMAMIVRGVMYSPMKVQTPPAARSVLPQETTTLIAVSEEWTEVATSLRNLLDGLPEDRRQSAVFHHPVSGGLTAAQGIGFILAHFHHHRNQIDSRIRESKYL